MSALVWVVASRRTAGRWTRGLEAEGYPAVGLAWSEIVCVEAEAEMRRALAGGRPDRLLLTSRSAASCLPTALDHGVPAACVGESTAQAARDGGLEVAEVGPGTGAGLAARLLADGEVRRVLFLRGRDAVEEGVERLRGAGVVVDEVVVYEARARAQFPEEVRAAPPARALVVGSPRAAQALVSALMSVDRGDVLAAPAAAIGMPTAEALVGLGFGAVAAAESPGLPGLSAALGRLLRAHPSR